MQENWISDLAGIRGAYAGMPGLQGGIGDSVSCNGRYAASGRRRCFDLQRELELRLAEAKRKVRFHMAFLKTGAVLEVLTVIFLMGFLGWIIS